MGLEGTYGVLTVGIIVVVSTLIIHISSLVILVESVRNLQIIILREIHHRLQSGRIILIVFIVVAAIADTGEIAATTYQLHLVRELVGKSLLHIEGLATIDVEDVGFCIERTGELNLIRCGALDAGLRIPFSGIEAEASTMAPLLVEVVVAGIEIGSPRFAVFT